MPARTRKKKTTRKKAHGNRASDQGRQKTVRESYSASGKSNGTAAQAPPTLHCALAGIEDLAVLLPTNVIAEVVEYGTPEPVRDTPEWFLGQIDWENRQVPVFSYASLINGSEPRETDSRSRIMIIKSLADSTRVPYLGILVNDIPKLMNVQPDQLVHTGDDRKSMGVFSQVTVQEQAAVIPDLERLTHLVTHTAYGALPITQVDG